MCSKQAEIITLYVQRLCPRKNTAAETVTPQLYIPFSWALATGAAYTLGRGRGRGIDRIGLSMTKALWN